MKIVPQYSFENKEFFVDTKFYPAENETVTAGRSVLSAPLVFHKVIPFLELAKTDLLLGENVIDSKWTIDPQNIRLQSAFVEFPGLNGLIGTNIGLNCAEALFGPGLPNNPYVLTIVKKTIPVIVGLSELACYSYAVDRTENCPMLQYVAENDLHLVFSMEASGDVYLATGDVCLTVHSFVLKNILNSKGKVLEVNNDKQLLDLTTYLETAKVVGYNLDAKWLQTDEPRTYQYELGDPNPIGRGIALLVRGYLLSVPSVGYAAEVTEPSANAVGVTKLYMEPDRISKPEWYVTIEEGFDLPPGECNVVFHARVADWKEPEPGQQAGTWLELGRWDSVAPGASGLWVEAIAQFLLDGEEYYLTNTLPDSIPNHSGYRAPENG